MTRLTSRKTSAFTLIELLVVVAIIAMLISILLPSLASARVEGQKVVCLGSSLHTLAQAAFLYAHEDPNNVLGPVHPWIKQVQVTMEGYMEYGGGPGDIKMGSIPVFNWNNNLDYLDPRTRPLNKVIYGKDGIAPGSVPGDKNYFKPFQCAGDERGYQVWPQGQGGYNGGEIETPAFKGDGTAYRMNNHQAPIAGGPNAGKQAYIGVYRRPVNRIPQPALTLFFFECRAHQTKYTNEKWGTASVPGATLDGYHRKKGYFTASYADGHAAFVNFGSGTYYPKDPKLLGGDWRGTWGRMDCMPDPWIIVDPKNP